MITQCLQSPKTSQGSSSFGSAGLRELEFGLCSSEAPAIAGESRPKHSGRSEPRPNADSTISLLTLETARFLHIANGTTLECRGLAASRRLESCMQSLEMT